MLRTGFCLFFLPFSFILSAPVSDSSSPAVLQQGIFLEENNWGNVQAGYEGNFVFDRRLARYADGEKRIDRYEIYIQSGDIQLDWQDKFSVFTTLGSGKIDTDFQIVANGYCRRAVLKSAEDFSWSLGLKALLASWKNLHVGAGCRYTTLEPLLHFFSLDGELVDTNGQRLHFREWQVNVGVSYEVGFFTPYIGSKYTQARSHVELPTSSNGITEDEKKQFFRSRQNFGLYLGCTITPRKLFFVTLETRLIDEEAVSVFATLRL